VVDAGSLSCVPYPHTTVRNLDVVNLEHLRLIVVLRIQVVITMSSVTDRIVVQDSRML
jgi:hypothetical protein